MTPLALQILKDFGNKRLSGHELEFAKKMRNVHCFELTDVYDLICPLAQDIYEGRHYLDCSETFLPAPITFIEWNKDGQRVGYLLNQSAHQIQFQFVSDYTDGWWVDELTNSLPSMRSIRPTLRPPQQINWDNGEFILALERAEMCVALALINTPRIIGRSQHMPHRGLEKLLRNRKATIGSFPLHAWTEIRLLVAPPNDMAGMPSTEAHLTGQKALHFCRSHLRVRFGKVEVVKAHWRGDPALGTRHSRYKLVA